MVQTGTDIELGPIRTPATLQGEPVTVEVVPVGSGGQSTSELTREAANRRAEVADRVLTLLTSLGNLALHIIELRQSSVTSDRDASTPAASVTPSSQHVADARPGVGRGQRRRRQRGSARGR